MAGSWSARRPAATGELKISLFGTSTGFAVVISDPYYGAIVPADQTPVEEVDDSLPTGTSTSGSRRGTASRCPSTARSTAPDGTFLIDEDFVSYYQPQGPVYRVSPDMASTATAGS